MSKRKAGDIIDDGDEPLEAPGSKKARDDPVEPSDLPSSAPSNQDDPNAKRSDSGTEQVVKESDATETQAKNDLVLEDGDQEGEKICFLADNKRLTIRTFKGHLLVDIREMFYKEGTKHPTKKGCSLNMKAWDKFMELLPVINEELSRQRNNK